MHLPPFFGKWHQLSFLKILHAHMLLAPRNCVHQNSIHPLPTRLLFELWFTSQASCLYLPVVL